MTCGMCWIEMNYSKYLMYISIFHFIDYDIINFINGLQTSVCVILKITYFYNRNTHRMLKGIWSNFDSKRHYRDTSNSLQASFRAKLSMSYCSTDIWRKWHTHAATSQNTSKNRHLDHCFYHKFRFIEQNLLISDSHQEVH